MSIRKIDPATALLVIDFQEGTRRFVGMVGPQVYSAAALLARAFRKRGLPVVLTITEGGRMGRTDSSPEGSDFVFPPEAQQPVPEIEQADSDIVIRRGAWGAFSGSDLQTLLLGKGVTQVVLCGTAASVGVESTARQAYDLGLNVTIALDAVSDFNPAAKSCSQANIYPLLAETGSAIEIIGGLDQP